MTSIEDRLRRDLGELAGRAQPDSIRPLRVPPGRGGSEQRRRRLAPVAAILAVAAVVGGGLLIGDVIGGPAPLPASAPRGVPAHFVSVVQGFHGPKGRVSAVAVVQDSVTGEALATVPVPAPPNADGSTEPPSLTGAGDGRTFVIGTSIQSAQQEKHGGATDTFYLLRVSADGRSARLSKLTFSVPPSLADTAQGIALSPDGRRLAISVQSCRSGRCQYTGVRVVTIATGTATTWSTRMQGAPFNLAWADNDHLAFEWQAGYKNSPAGHYRLLNLAGAGRDLLAATPVGSPPAESSGYVPPAFVTADGSTTITTMSRIVPDGDGTYIVVGRIVELSARTGHLHRVRYTMTTHTASADDATMLAQSCHVESMTPSGAHVLVDCFGLGRLDGGYYTSLPEPPGTTPVGGLPPNSW